jgi:hypothetical protein
MLAAITALLSSRKFLTGAMSITAVICAVVLQSLGKIPPEALIPTIIAITTTGLGFIGATAYEDGAAKGAGGRDAPPPAPVVQNAPAVNVEPARGDIGPTGPTGAVG